MTVREMLSKLDSRELTEWLIFMKMEVEKNKPKDAPVEDKVKFSLGGYGKLRFK